jgi:hypothetical protein
MIKSDTTDSYPHITMREYLIAQLGVGNGSIKVSSQILDFESYLQI